MHSSHQHFIEKIILSFIVSPPLCFASNCLTQYAFGENVQTKTDLWWVSTLLVAFCVTVTSGQPAEPVPTAKWTWNGGPARFLPEKRVCVCWPRARVYRDDGKTKWCRNAELPVAGRAAGLGDGTVWGEDFKRLKTVQTCWLYPSFLLCAGQATSLHAGSTFSCSLRALKHKVSTALYLH